MKPQKRLPAALALFDLVPPVNPLTNVGLHVFQPVSLSAGCTKPSPAADTAAPLTPEPSSAPVWTDPDPDSVADGSAGS
jgi:hypothetical protein